MSRFWYYPGNQSLSIDFLRNNPPARVLFALLNFCGVYVKRPSRNWVVYHFEMKLIILSIIKFLGLNGLSADNIAALMVITFLGVIILIQQIFIYRYQRKIKYFENKSHSISDDYKSR